ncbi:competence type IV pilus minor pilin ComGE [Bacillus sp. CLL-7-23]|uniref:Competence type IV pilus minor pilin ComGE n=1 Tax=Bacillus changyiensis TaxID=3004103 RepID=A0ABT4X3U8_9BACI|nr:competence type IV pilus minor pilin ComGE [Bacillus changyiensis]MDA7026960.1 competence type IV pilus minor pilin ComGE [Bacillus changyiensis]
MFKKNSGFTTIETVSAFSIWLMITILFVPMFHQFTLKEEMTRKEVEAYRILDEKLNRYLITGRYQPAETVFYQGTAYLIDWEGEGDHYNVCVSIEDRKNQQHCFTILRTKGLYPS